MKKSSTLMIVAGVLVGLVIGFLVGISVDYPKVEDESLAGTISKVDKYRNAKVSEADIQLQNDLVADTATLKALKQYILYHYLDAIKMAGNIQTAVTQANGIEAFKTKNTRQIEGIAHYGTYLASSRSYFLAALATIQDPKATDPALIRNSLNQVNNLIAQKNYRSRVVVDFIDQSEIFIASNPSGDVEGLKQAHDLLALNMVNASLVTGDKVMQKFLGKKPLFTDFRKLSWYDPVRTMKQVQNDIEQMGVWYETEKLQFIDAEKMGAMDAEKMGAGDAEKMGYVHDAEKLGELVCDAGKLGIANVEQLSIFDTEKLGPFIITDVDKLGVFIYDAEKMGIYLDAEKMGGFIIDAEKLGIQMMDAEKLGSQMLDAEKMGIFGDAEKMGIYLDAEKMGIIR
ncbi:MAG: hypothetical protein V2A67_11835 [Bacteroidota bacterium]